MSIQNKINELLVIQEKIDAQTQELEHTVYLLASLDSLIKKCQGNEEIESLVITALSEYLERVYTDQSIAFQSYDFKLRLMGLVEQYDQYYKELAQINLDDVQ
jgi:hypothetical protein